MRPRWILRSLLIVSICLSASSGSAQDNLMNPKLLWKLGRLGDACLSADGKQVAYTVRRYNLEENSGKSSVFLLNLETNEQKTLIENWPSVSALQWAPTPDGEALYFTGMDGSDDDATPQAWRMKTDSDEKPTQVTKVEGGISNLKVSPNGAHLAFTVDVKMDKTVNELYADLPKADARIIDSLMYRHWNQWHDYKYTHLHVAALDDRGIAGNAVDLMKGLKADCPVPPFGGSEQFNWSPESNEIAYTMKMVERWAESTNSDVYTIAIDGKSEPQNISKENQGYDNDPFYSPDGKRIGYHSMKRAGFESDRNRVMSYDRATKSITDLTAGLDQMAHGAMWADDSGSVMFSSEYRGTNQLFRVATDQNGASQFSKGRYNWNLVDVFPDGKRALVTQTSMIRPAELGVMDMMTGETKIITKINDDVYANLKLPTVRERWVTATDGKKIHCWVIFPPDFDESKKYPMLTYCQGGPQGQIGQWFSYRWNFHLMAANGYVIIAPNRRGLPGFGREWNDQISGDWGGQAMQDLLSATDSMFVEPYIDRKRAAAIGASFGGYTVYWMMGNHKDRFAAMIAHCGVFNLESMYGSTEELFFVNWDLGGPYWKDQAIQKEYDQFSPHRFVGNWKTPLMVIHGEKDFRVPITQGMEAFTAAQVQGVPSRFLYYPNEGHWVLGPQNGVLWHRVFFDWLDRYCK